ncbi:PAS domain-containing protein [Dongia sedimenti]|uniref:PAS domain-containing protein n=1 Tax=Dongia sedimenti TaxID=3064282 RepID=A0ABU0YUF0_9PROT|nr:PAS domain-containing protein [Rhodospirillaceae bacterium R-7]
MNHPTASGQDAPDFIQHRKLADLFRYWRGLSRDGQVPRRRDIDPLQLIPALPHVQLLDLGPTPDDLRYRLVGQTIIDAFGFDPRHLTRGEIKRRYVLPENRAAFDETSRQTHAIATRGIAAYTHDHMTSYAREFLAYARLLLPISEDGHAITGVFGAIYYSGDRDDFWRNFQELHVERPIAAFGIGVS